jgi:hypothetical protein
MAIFHNIRLRYFFWIMLIPMAMSVYVLAFPQEVRSFLPGLSSLRREGPYYFSASVPRHQVDSLMVLVQGARQRVRDFWGGLEGDPRILFCMDPKDYRQFSVNPDAPAVTYLKLGSVIVLSSDGADLDILSHELSHVEFRKRVGALVFERKVPSWFKHGLAMQNDWRASYGEDTLRARLAGLGNLPDVRSLVTDDRFYSGTRDEIKLHYMLARHAVAAWYTRERLTRLLSDLRSGKPFQEAMDDSR